MQIVFLFVGDWPQAQHFHSDTGGTSDRPGLDAGAQEPDGLDAVGPATARAGSSSRGEYTSRR